jgi:hypothetical protein
METTKRSERHKPVPIVIERVQTGVRLEKRILKVLKALSEYYDISLGDLIEGIVLHAFDGKPPFAEESLGRIREIKKIYDLDLDASHSHKLIEKEQQVRDPSAQDKDVKRRKR